MKFALLGHSPPFDFPSFLLFSPLACGRLWDSGANTMTYTTEEGYRGSPTQDATATSGKMLIYASCAFFSIGLLDFLLFLLRKSRRFWISVLDFLLFLLRKGQKPALAPVASADRDCKMAIVKARVCRIPTLSLFCLRVLRDVIQRTDITMPLTLSRLLPVLIKSGEQAVIGKRVDEYNAVMECARLMCAVTNLMRQSQRDEINSICIKAHIVFTFNKARHDITNIRTFQIFGRMSKNVLSMHYDDMMPILISIVRERRSEPLCMAALNAIARFGDSVMIIKFQPDFIQTFNIFAFFGLIDGNSKHVMNNEANVVIRKACDSDKCTNCACPPVWCCECLARSFLESAPSVDQEAACPTCRATYCVKDVAIVSDEEKSEDY